MARRLLGQRLHHRQRAVDVAVHQPAEGEADPGIGTRAVEATQAQLVDGPLAGLHGLAASAEVGSHAGDDGQPECRHVRALAQRDRSLGHLLGVGGAADGDQGPVERHEGLQLAPAVVELAEDVARLAGQGEAALGVTAPQAQRGQQHPHHPLGPALAPHPGLAGHRRGHRLGLVEAALLEPDPRQEAHRPAEAARRRPSPRTSRPPRAAGRRPAPGRPARTRSRPGAGPPRRGPGGRRPAS